MSSREENRRRAAAVVSVALGETGAPYDDVCIPDCTEHDTCAVVWALWDAGLLDASARPPYAMIDPSEPDEHP